MSCDVTSCTPAALSTNQATSQDPSQDPSLAPSPTLEDAIARVKAGYALDDHPYLRALREGSLDREAFARTQAQFLHAVAFFARPVAALAARLPTPAMRGPLLENAYEEHGQGSLSASHEQTFLTLLARLGWTPQALREQAMWPEVRAFNAMFWGVCVQDHPLTGVAMVAMFEELFAGISARVGRAIQAQGWLPASQIVHYSLHESLDLEHARALYDVARPWYDQPQERYAIDQGLELGAHALMGLWEALWLRRHQRQSLAQRGEHALRQAEPLGWG